MSSSNKTFLQQIELYGIQGKTALRRDGAHWLYVVVKISTLAQPHREGQASDSVRTQVVVHWGMVLPGYFEETPTIP